LAVHADAAVSYVNLNSPSPVSPYSSWATAATNIQDAVNAASPGDLVLVTNGIYQTGGYNNSGSNRVNLNKTVVVQSINGPAVTIVKGYQVPGTTNGPASVRCAYVASGATLAGFTLTGGSMSGNGGGVLCQSSSSIVSNCIITGNCASTLGGGSAFGWYKNCVISSNVCFYDGGGNYAGSFTNCLIIGNSTQSEGGGAYYAGSFVNCTIVGNRAGDGAGVYAGVLKNCIVYYNNSTFGSNIFNTQAATNCCTAPTNGMTACVSNPPLFVNLAGGDLRLQSSSPCINAGNNAFASGADLDGRPRIVGASVDIGAFEFQGTNIAGFISWLAQYGLSTDGSADSADSDGDGANNYAEWRAGTIPTNPNSALRLQAPAVTVSNATVTWQSVTNVTYYLQRGANLSGSSIFSTIKSNVAGQAGTTSFTDTNSILSGPRFYRVGVQ
jgi:hypothetical protein